MHTWENIKKQEEEKDTVQPNRTSLIEVIVHSTPIKMVLQVTKKEEALKMACVEQWLGDFSIKSSPHLDEYAWNCHWVIFLTFL